MKNYAADPNHVPLPALPAWVGIAFFTRTATGHELDRLVGTDPDTGLLIDQNFHPERAFVNPKKDAYLSETPDAN